MATNGHAPRVMAFHNVHGGENTKQQDAKSRKFVDFYCGLASAFGGRRIHHLGDAVEAFNRGACCPERRLPFAPGRLPDNPEMNEEECPLLAQSGHSRWRQLMSAFGVRADIAQAFLLARTRSFDR
jgi:hypothetical protein